MKFSKLKLTTPYLKLDPLFFDEVEPTPLDNPFVISTSQDAAKLLGIDEDLNLDEKLLEIVNGSIKLEGSQTFAMCYAGHQFGHFSPRLGDGRAINLGKINGQNLQLKGSGLTLYSREGDGRAVLRSSIREYLMSEAMHGLGIATSRALALIGSDTDVARERWEKGAIVLRLSPTWVRFGTFEYFNSQRKTSMLQDLADYVLKESFPHLVGEEDCYMKMYAEIVKNTATTIAGWISVGFNHGVLNTDNMSIDGRTIDYGPFAFLDDYESHYVCNHTDHEGRYSFKSQIGIGHWNLERLAMALSPIINYEYACAILDTVYYEAYEDAYLARMRKRLGLFVDNQSDKGFIGSMLGSLSNATIDFNLFFRKLSSYDGNKTPLLDIAVSRAPIEKFLAMYDERLKKETLSQNERHQKMLGVNPKYILKNHILQMAIENAKIDDFTMVNDLLKVALSPCEEHVELEYLCIATPQKAKNIKLSCSS
ncbi:YdiU family protein [Sulfurimonas sp. SAG-AH-194-I05]|nr:YdiU family protein [Sulfurimonas sp. SAG-AH-194-I05]MDF1876093.1 YdiU family protein [Sulfurimonas sp. SAG-AH-194-I05]